jgi:hypothetical protein
MFCRVLEGPNIHNTNTDLVESCFFVVVVRIVDVRVVSFVTVETGIWRYEEQ